MASEMSPEYLEILRAMTGTQKLRAAGQLHRTAKKTKAARLRELQPVWSEQQIDAPVKEISLYAGG